MATTDVPLDWLTGGLMVATFATAVVAYLGMRRAGDDAKEARQEAAVERKANAEAARTRFLADVVLRIAESLEAANNGSQTDQQRIRGALSALPLDMLPMLRLWLNVYPTGDGRVLGDC
ncbi:MAG TPA: hypothetical protein VFH54_01775 [Mycobacteriales bacterium]|nr:hypothetical protein [Mycobacteriales bacterium]